MRNVARNGPERLVVDERRHDAAEDAEQDRVDVEQPGDQHQREEARDDEVLHRVDAEHLQRVELLADLARAEVGGDRRAGHAGEHDRGHERRELADRGEHEEAAEPVERAEQHEEVRRLQARRRVAERDRRDDAAGTSTASARTGTGTRTRRRTGTAGGRPTRWSSRSGSSCRPLLRAGFLPVGRPYRRRLVPIRSPLRYAGCRRVPSAATDYGRGSSPANGNRGRTCGPAVDPAPARGALVWSRPG